MILAILAISCVLLCVLVLLALGGRVGHPGLEELRRWNYAHRGLHGNGVPENSMAAFRAALDRGYGVELDVHLLRDGSLAVCHDSALMRTTGQAGRIEDLTEADLKNYSLEGSRETIPTFREVLELFGGNAPLIVELKPVGGNHAALCEAVCALLDGYRGPYCLESFDPRCVAWLRRNRPTLVRGQLTEYFLESDTKMPWVLRFLLSHNLLNWMGRPDFVAYRFAHRNKTPTNRICRELLRIQGVTWTLKSPQEHTQAAQEGQIPIFEGYLP